MSPLLILAVTTVMVGNRIPVGHFRHGGRSDPDRHPAGAAALAGSDGAARRHADGLERLARAAVVAACALAHGRRLSDRVPDRARCLEPVALRPVQAGRADRSRRHAVPGAPAPRRPQAEPGQRDADRHLWRVLHHADAADRCLRPDLRLVLPRRQTRPARDRRHQVGLPGVRSRHEARLLHGAGGSGRRHRSDRRRHWRSPPRCSAPRSPGRSWKCSPTTSTGSGRRG